MRSLRLLACGVAALAAMGASSTSAANWDPLNTTFTATPEGQWDALTTDSGLAVICLSSDLGLRVAGTSPATASTIAAHNPVAFGSCVALGTFPTDVTTFGTWHFTATDTTDVDIRATPDASGRVATFSITTIGCGISIDGPVNLGPNDWNNSTQTLRVNPSSTFPLTAYSTGAVPLETCQTAIGTTGSMNVRYRIPGMNLT